MCVSLEIPHSARDVWGEGYWWWVFLLPVPGTQKVPFPTRCSHRPPPGLTTATGHTHTTRRQIIQDTILQPQAQRAAHSGLQKEADAGAAAKAGSVSPPALDLVGVANLKNEASGQAEANSFGAVTGAGATRSSSRGDSAFGPRLRPVEGPRRGGGSGPSQAWSPQVPASPAKVPDSGRSLQLT